VVGVTTVALLERKTGISRSLFTRYWRDVHGVLAARIPGFESYTQHHVMPIHDVGSHDPEPFEGIAVVTYANEADRQGLGNSEVTSHIHRDEQNVFRRALLYNLEAGASRTRIAPPADDEIFGAFLLVPAGHKSGIDDLVVQLGGDGIVGLCTHDLTSGDPKLWNETFGTNAGEGRRFVGVIQADWSDRETALTDIRKVVKASNGAIAAYAVDETYVMVEGGRPTQIGLRGLDAVRTIQEAGAVNQLDEAVVRAVYGRFPRT
jgi:hypothetical protein